MESWGEYRTLREEEIELGLFSAFRRRQVVCDCWRRENGKWVIRPEPFVDDWSRADYEFLVKCLKKTIRMGGVVIGAFAEGCLKGFASVEAERLGTMRQYADLTSLHVSEELRGRGLGKELFFAAAAWARGHGAEKLYISAHSAAETQAFYRGIGCVEAQEYQQKHVEQEPYDCQLEYRL